MEFVFARIDPEFTRSAESCTAEQGLLTSAEYFDLTSSNLTNGSVRGAGHSRRDSPGREKLAPGQHEIAFAYPC